MSSFALQMKHYQASGRDLFVVGPINYIVAALAAGAWVIQKGEFEVSDATWIIGILCGVAYFASYFFLAKAIKSSGISIAWSVVQLSVLVPILFSIFYWKEYPNAYQIGGIVLVCVSLPFLSVRPGSGNVMGRISPIVIALFFVTGGIGLSAKTFSEVSPTEQRQMYLLFLFGTTAIVSTSFAIVKKRQLRLTDIPRGVILGVCNLMAGHFLLLSLSRLPGMLVFPVAGSMGIVVTTLAGVSIWGEKLRRLTIIGLIVAVMAVAFINLK